jgi:DNA mismatch endonuclease (patch repair protein)
MSRDTPIRGSSGPVQPSVSTRMARQRRRDTDPEMALRRALHARGLRYVVDAPLPGMPRRRADVLFTKKKVAVFLDGCFWHGCPLHRTYPQNNADWWLSKIEANIARDRDTDRRLTAAGWSVVRVWEHEPVDRAVERVESSLNPTDV